MQAAAFDQLAGDYDAGFSHPPLGSALRAMVAGRFAKVFQGARRLLDPDCGTGENASRLADPGVSVPGMYRRGLACFADHYVEATRLPRVAGTEVRDAKRGA